MVSHFTVKDTPLEGVKLIQRHPIRDQRGYLERVYCKEQMDSVFGEKNICQVNHTFTSKIGTVKGLHFQYPPHEEMKLIQCIKGRVYDVAVDLRKNSATYLQYYAVVLDSQNHQSILIPEGFAHGLQTLTDDCELIYFHTASYQPNYEGIIDATDSDISIEWPNLITIRSDRDLHDAISCEEFSGLEL